MTREEEENRGKKITEAAESEYFPTMAEMFAYIHGAEWADQNPRKGLWDADKVIKWLQDNADLYTWYDEFEGESGMTDNFIEDLKKAMEG